MAEANDSNVEAGIDNALFRNFTGEVVQLAEVRRLGSNAVRPAIPQETTGGSEAQQASQTLADNPGPQDINEESSHELGQARPHMSCNRGSLIVMR